MNTIKKSDLIQFLTEKKLMMGSNPVIAPPKPKTKPNTPVTPKHPKPAVNPKPKAGNIPEKINDPMIPVKPKTKPNPIKNPPRPKPAVSPKPKANMGESDKMSKKVKINKKYPRKFVKEHINSYFSVDIVNESINDDYSVELQLVGEKTELIKCLKNLKEGNVIN